MKNFTQDHFLDVVFNSDSVFFGISRQVNSNDGSCNILSVVDDLIDTRNTLGDVHTRNTGEVESLEGHLGSWLTDALGCNGTDSLSGLHNALINLFNVNLKEVVKLVVSDSVETVLQVFLVFFVCDFDSLAVCLEGFCFLLEVVLDV